MGRRHLLEQINASLSASSTSNVVIICMYTFLQLYRSTINFHLHFRFSGTQLATQFKPVPTVIQKWARKVEPVHSLINTDIMLLCINNNRLIMDTDVVGKQNMCIMKSYRFYFSF